MAQPTLDYRRLSPGQLAALGAQPAGYETMSRRHYGQPDAGMLGRRLARGPAGDGGQALAHRRRQLELLKLAAG